MFSTAWNTQRDSQSWVEKEGKGGDRGDLGEKKESKGGEGNQASSHTPK